MENNEKPKLTVKLVGDAEAKSTQEIEKDLLDKHEESLKAEETPVEKVEKVDTTAANPAKETEKIEEQKKEETCLPKTLNLMKTV